MSDDKKKKIKKPIKKDHKKKKEKKEKKPEKPLPAEIVEEVEETEEEEESEDDVSPEVKIAEAKFMKVLEDFKEEAQRHSNLDKDKLKKMFEKDVDGRVRGDKELAEAMEYARIMAITERMMQFKATPVSYVLSIDAIREFARMIICPCCMYGAIQSNLLPPGATPHIV